MQEKSNIDENECDMCIHEFGILHHEINRNHCGEGRKHPSDKTQKEKSFLAAKFPLGKGIRAEGTDYQGNNGRGESDNQAVDKKAVKFLFDENILISGKCRFRYQPGRGFEELFCRFD